MKFDLAKLMQERLAEINNIKKKAFSKDADHTLYVIKTIKYSVTLKEGSVLYYAFKSYEDLENFVNSKHALETEESNPEVFLFRDINREDVVQDIKEFVDCSEGETIKLVEYGGEKRFFENEGDSRYPTTKFIFGPTDIVNTHELTPCKPLPYGAPISIEDLLG